MKKPILSAFALGLASPAFSLSCLPPDPVWLYEMARDAEESFFFVRGRIHADRPVALPQEGKVAETRVRITGAVLTTEGFTAAFDRGATLRLTCAGPWCAGAPSEAEVFVAVELEGRSLVAEVGPCGLNAIAADDAGAARVEACHNGGPCEKTGPL